MRERCKILCKNKNCMFWEATNKKEYFKKTKIYVPFDDDYYSGICTKSTIKLVPIYHETRNYMFKFVSCNEGKYVPNDNEPCIECSDKSCLWNNKNYCDRTDGIAINIMSYGSGNDLELSCRAQSEKKIKGHIDLFRFVGQREGSHIPDPVGYEDKFWSRKEEEIKQLRNAGVPEENLNTIYGRDVH